MKFDFLTREVIASAIEVHSILGPGLLESTYQKCLEEELSIRRLSFRAQFRQEIRYKEKIHQEGFRIDLLVENTLVVELKTVETLKHVHAAQILTYMKLGNYPVGLLINFHVTQLTRGIRRFVN